MWKLITTLDLMSDFRAYNESESYTMYQQNNSMETDV